MVATGRQGAAKPSGIEPPVGARLVGATNKGNHKGCPYRLPDFYQRSAARRKTPCSGAPEGRSQRLLSRLSDARPTLSRPPRR